ncbi:MAG TPA: hypothetical protein VLS86_08670, partial [Acidimicrobiia bacterium]|nr:hypothetical protein [Acidimicrobiia bacterium]
MSRLGRFEHYRYLGARDTMTFYDCDDESQFEDLKTMVEAEDLVGRNRLQAFAPDTPEEAANRGYHAVAAEGEPNA